MPPASRGRTSLFVFYTHILNHLPKEKSKKTGFFLYILVEIIPQNDSDHNEWLILPTVPVFVLFPVWELQVFTVPPGDSRVHVSERFYIWAFPFLEASKSHAGLSHHPFLWNNMWKKQMITTKGQTTAHISDVSDGVLYLHGTAVSKDDSSNGNKLLFWSWLMWGFFLETTHWWMLTGGKKTFSASLHSMWPELVVTQGSDCSGLWPQDWSKMWLNSKWL